MGADPGLIRALLHAPRHLSRSSLRRILPVSGTDQGPRHHQRGSQRPGSYSTDPGKPDPSPTRCRPPPGSYSTGSGKARELSTTAAMPRGGLSQSEDQNRPHPAPAFVHLMSTQVRGLSLDKATGAPRSDPQIATQAEIWAHKRWENYPNNREPILSGGAGPGLPGSTPRTTPGDAGPPSGPQRPAVGRRWNAAWPGTPQSRRSGPGTAQARSWQPPGRARPPDPH